MNKKLVQLIITLISTIILVTAMILINRYTSFSSKVVKTVINDLLGVGIILNAAYGIYNFCNKNSD